MDFKEHLILLRNAFEKSNIPELKRLSGEFAGDAFIHYRKENIQMSIIAYACAKFLEKPYILADPAWDSFRKSTSRKAWRKECRTRKKYSHEILMRIVI